MSSEAFEISGKGESVKPYFEEDGIVIFHGDCREILPQIEGESIVTDPVWPNCEHIFPGINAHALLNDALLHAPSIRRVVVHLGCNSDPRFLSAVPLKWPYLRARATWNMPS